MDEAEAVAMAVGAGPSIHHERVGRLEVWWRGRLSAYEVNTFIYNPPRRRIDSLSAGL